MTRVPESYNSKEVSPVFKYFTVNNKSSSASQIKLQFSYNFKLFGSDPQKSDIKNHPYVSVVCVIQGPC